MRTALITLTAVAAAIALAGCSSATSGHPHTGSNSAATSPSTDTGSSAGATAASTPSGCGNGCSQGSFEARALVLAPVPLTATDRPTAVNPLAGLGFTIPTSDTAYAHLPASQQTRLTSILAHIKCSTPPPAQPGTARAVCGSNDTQGMALLLGPTILTQQDIASAKAQPPSASSPQWAVAITLTSAGTSAWATYTAAHNTAGLTDGSAATCSTTGTPCADYVAFVVNNAAVSVPVTTAAITGGSVQISGNFNQQSATTLARQIAS